MRWIRSFSPASEGLPGLIEELLNHWAHRDHKAHSVVVQVAGEKVWRLRVRVGVRLSVGSAISDWMFDV